jgi:glycosyltransferase involved in cell wall biosynthesis
MSAKKLLFLATEDWFVRSHFMPLVARAQAEGYDVSVAARASGANLNGARLIDMPFARGSLHIWDVGRELGAVRDLLHREEPDIVHAIALKPIALLLMAGARDRGRAFAVTGRGYMAVRGAAWTRLILDLLARRLRAAVATSRAMLLVENTADRLWVEGGAPLPDDHVALMPGAGVDPVAFSPATEPAPSPIIVGIASRLVWSKGIDLAVEAVRQLRASGLDIELHVAGAADPHNPEHVEDADIATWRATPGVRLLGRVEDINAFWAGAHIACAPSRGGEGLPRALLEAAACGRPIVTTDAPGCDEFVIGGQTGLVVSREDAAALADALRRLAENAAARRRMGEHARARVLASYTERHAADCAAAAWRRLAD